MPDETAVQHFGFCEEAETSDGLSVEETCLVFLNGCGTFDSACMLQSEALQNHRACTETGCLFSLTATHQAVASAEAIGEMLASIQPRSVSSCFGILHSTC